LSSLSDGVIICDGKGRLLLFNEAAISMIGQDVTDRASSEWSAHYGVYYQEGGCLVPENELPLVRAMTGEAVDNVELFARSEKRPAGIHLQCSARPVYNDAHVLQGAIVVCRDISERKQIGAEISQRQTAEAHRQDAEKRSLRMASMLQVLLDHLDLVVWSVDDKGVFTFHDGRGSEPIGVPRGSLVGKNSFDLYPNSRGLQQAFLGTPQHDISADDKIIWENWYVPVKDHEGDAWNVIGLSLDITEAHRVKQDLEAKLALIERQQAVISDLETPVIQVWDRILTLPMVGVVDSRRASRVTDDLLDQVSRTQARFAILDLTGVEVVDTATAGHVVNIISAVRLLGAEGIITGIRPTIAQTIISLGVDLSRVRTLATLRDGLAFAIRRLAEQEAAASTPLLRAPQRTNA
jgi:anti-anti-sigma regulatory factor/PAS domain-containing protein